MQDISERPSAPAPDHQARAIEGFRDLMVHLDNTAEDEVRIAHAEAIAGMCGAHLTGIYTTLLPDYGMVSVGDATGAAISALVEVEEQARREGAEASKLFSKRFSRLGVPGELRRVDASPGEMVRHVVTEARWSDLFVATCPYRDDAASGWDEILETVLFEGGHSVYFVPPGMKPRPRLNRVMIAWSDTRQSARAVAEALPFLRASSDVEIVVVESKHEANASGYVATDIAAHLDRHGTKVTIRPVEQEHWSVSEALLEQVLDRSADLVVMGAYGHSRWREWIMGGTTREMLQTSTVPLLMAH
jgi:nucleotide-binding universal stress UspA family protein